MELLRRMIPPRAERLRGDLKGRDAQKLKIKKYTPPTTGTTVFKCLTTFGRPNLSSSPIIGE
jgi:hypothetical protein